jgi:hypothetical protein
VTPARAAISSRNSISIINIIVGIPPGCSRGGARRPRTAREVRDVSSAQSPCAAEGEVSEKSEVELEGEAGYADEDTEG